ncbi:MULTISPECIES: flagellar motor switch protein FliG [unclassified Gilliamella]|uniref:flagellar motor switch protein FliG n=1 Tax=unclassified Gilliamella TaxID=2685620 RepID=UPI00080E2F91|nr:MULTISPECIES: flagellar motor switch protein FliG [Gilliamella]MCX8581833.1 flagellar motor switch protein FliG [Gilliamella sp. B3482]MCX8597415.1 flagellar motor switch protein FliG [Gilliamella sp. B3493]MCX8599802.1 flagellar motor switch protein FliG [Gilliamella sp. B3486]MCX8661127.1 flagellar motor switch protein FliG [Gilliamella sp. B2772]MCX8662263.1 flagellar motor switch protein FliG [Gilliamella sp. B2911]
MNLSESQKAATILMILGEELAAKVMQFLDHKEVQQISSAMMGLPQLTQEQLKNILNECQTTLDDCAVLNTDTNGYLRKVLEKSIGSDKASRLLDELLDTDIEDTTDGLKMLNFVDAARAVDLVKKEHPQIIATILVHLNRDLAAEILNLFDDDLRNDVMLRIATFGGVEPSALEVLSTSLSTLLHGQNIKLNNMGGIRTAAEIINLMKSQQEELVINALRDYDNELAQKIIDEMFLFENLVDVDDRSIQRLLKDVDNETLIIALKGATEPLREKLLSNMSQRAASILREDLENRPPVRLSQVETEQKKILVIARRLAETGEMILSSGDDEYV